MMLKKHKIIQVVCPACTTRHDKGFLSNEIALLMKFTLVVNGIQTLPILANDNTAIPDQARSMCEKNEDHMTTQREPNHNENLLCCVTELNKHCRSEKHTCSITSHGSNTIGHYTAILSC